MTYNKYFQEKTDKEKTDANTEMRKGHYNGEMYHSLQDSTHRLMVVYYIVATVFTALFIYRGEHKKTSWTSLAVGATALAVMPHAFYYYVTDSVVYLINSVAEFVTKMSTSKLISLATTVVVGIFILGSLFSVPTMAIIMPVIIAIAACLILIGVILRSAFMA